MADIITSAEALDALPDDALIEASGRYSDGGTFTRCHLRPVPRFIGGTSERMYEVLVYGSTWPQNLVPAEQIELPATVLYRPDTTPAAPVVKRFAQTQAIREVHALLDAYSDRIDAHVYDEISSALDDIPECETWTAVPHEEHAAAGGRGNRQHRPVRVPLPRGYTMNRLLARARAIAYRRGVRPRPGSILYSPSLDLIYGYKDHRGADGAP